MNRKEDATIPKRGEKDFEPHATALQSNTLAASRQAMHNALSYQRVHAPKGYTVGTYHPETNMAYTLSPKGPLFAKMGHVRSAKDDPLGSGVDPQRGQRIWLLPEEVLYMVERGTLDVRWPTLEDDGDAQGLPMSLQGAYAMFLGDNELHNDSLTFERYSVYSGLKRMGYTVLRAPSWNTAGPPPGPECYPPLPTRRTWQAGLLTSLAFWRMSWFSKEDGHSTNQTTGPVIPPALYRDYSSIYQRLALINFHDPTSHFGAEEDPIETDPNFRITYHVWKPGSTTFKKSAPGIPDFRIAVVNARETTPPTLEQMGALMDSTPYDPPKQDGHMHAKLKHGYKNVILAIVDQGVTSYLRISDAAFGQEKVYERRAPARGGKRGGGRGGRGGRGRGR